MASIFKNTTPEEGTTAVQPQGFELIELTEDRVLVRGTDSSQTYGEEVVYAPMRAKLIHDQEVEAVLNSFDSDVEVFFAPLTDAAERVQAAHDAVHAVDETAYLVQQEGVAAVEAVNEVIVKLGRGDHIVRLIEEGQEHRLVWVADKLEILK